VQLKSQKNSPHRQHCYTETGDDGRKVLGVGVQGYFDAE
jgi:hypothetical protein